MKVTVVGGGAVGLCCAYELASAAVEVSIVERGVCGEAASRGNAGWVVPSLSAPMPAPGVVKQALKWMLKRNSPVRLRPRVDFDFLLWSWLFLRSSSLERNRAGLRAMIAFGGRSAELFDELRDAGVSFEMHSSGLLIVALSEATLEEYAEIFRDLEEAGYPNESDLLDRNAARRLEPALSNAVAGALHAKSERHVRPESFTRGLFAHLVSAGVRIIEHAEVVAIEHRKGGGWRVLTLDSEISSDSVLVAAGAWSKALLAKAGVRMPLEAARGCSLTAKGLGIRPRHALKLADVQVACTPFEEGVRVSGTFDLNGMDSSLDPGRLRTVIDTAAPYLADFEFSEPQLEWAGLRPVTPDGLPLIGSMPGLQGLYVATGHGTLGVTLAPATGKAIASIILRGRIPPELEPFRTSRFWTNRKPQVKTTSAKHATL